MFKNKDEREKFLREYKKWPTLENGCAEQIHVQSFHEVPPLTFYRYEFRNGSVVIVKGYLARAHDEAHFFDIRYNLIIKRKDDRKAFARKIGCTPSEFMGYSLQGVSVAIIVDYMTKRKNEI